MSTLKQYTYDVIIEFGGKYSTFVSDPSASKAKEILLSLKEKGVSFESFYVSLETNPCLVMVSFSESNDRSFPLSDIVDGKYPESEAEIIKMISAYRGKNKIRTFESWDEIFEFIN